MPGTEKFQQSQHFLVQKKLSINQNSAEFKARNAQILAI